jgi:hypothetical protein
VVNITPASQVTLSYLEERYSLQPAGEADFCTEWSTALPTLNELEQQYLDRVRANFSRLLKTPPLLENSVKMVVISPLLDLAGFYQEPFRITSEPGFEVNAVDEQEMIRGRIDVLVLQGLLWILVLESKRSDFAVSMAIPQALACMMVNPQNENPTFGLISNGNDFLFLKLLAQPHPLYAHSRLFSLLNPGNELYSVLQVLKNIGLAFY